MNTALTDESASELVELSGSATVARLPLDERRTERSPFSVTVKPNGDSWELVTCGAKASLTLDDLTTLVTLLFATVGVVADGWDATGATTSWFLIPVIFHCS